ncbi:EpsG family protein [Ramlibacter pallidus]|uniref:EpsG family protein n=1 Tax=Ramlibacter pallidus TaxID=2780087 RepID=A0ABR9SAC2_9BURK|nr:EpsG family protein [Ramlibacter pallidus]MBE7369917.1 EpsG family protein [Ramlibacter pallidus]
MWPYWILFLLPALAAFTAGTGPRAHLPQRQARWTPGWLFAAAATSLMIGLRYQVGGDWFNYLRYLETVQGATLQEVVTMKDPGYRLLNWLSDELDWDIFGVNLVSGTIFTIGLACFCRSLPRPWLAFAVAVPYMVIVVGMGYTRQGVALGFAMLGLLALQKRSIAWFVVWVVLGATFHRSAVLLLPIAALANSRNRYLTIGLVGVVTASAYFLLLQDSVDDLIENYIEAEYQSEGALVRLLMNAAPALVLLLFRRRFRFAPGESGLWLWLAVISLALLAGLLVSPSTTALDRLGLYMLPLQLVVLSHLPSVFGSPGRANRAWVVAILAYCAAVQFVWLNYASHSVAWKPYRFYLFE